MHVVKATNVGTPLLLNGGFEEVLQKQPAQWSAWAKGFRLGGGEGRGGSQCVVCERREGDGEFGASQTLALNRTNTAPFTIRGWSKAEQVSDSPDNGYSLYADILYADGTSLWGQTANFTCGTHDWEKREFVLLPDKPVKSLTLHCLFRGHTGKVWFDDISLAEIPTPEGAVLFQGVPVAVLANPKPAGKPPKRKFATRDGLTLTVADYTVASLRLDGREFAAGAPSGFLVRDYAAGSDFYGFPNGACEELGLKLTTEITASKDHITISGRLADTTAKDRAVTLLFALPLDATGWRWGDDMRQSRPITGHDEYANTVSLRCGADKRMSRYPLAAVWNDRAGLALALDMDHPAQYRLVEHAGTKQFFIAYDFGLAQDTVKFPDSADFRFIVYRFDSRWGFRAALQKFYDIFPQHFTKRVTHEGVWMPFTDVASVPGFEDFGFAFQEGASNVSFDDRHGIASFVYVEPTSHWLAMPPEVPRTYDSAMSVLKNDLAGARGDESRRMAAATFTSSIELADGRFFLYLVKAPWCDGGVFALNPDPEIATTPERPFNKATVMRQAIEAAFEKNRPKPPPSAPQFSTLNPQPAPGLDGVYLDSLEMSCNELNYRREHFRTASVPLVFDREGRPCQLMIFNTWTFERDIAAQMRARDKLMFANAVLWQFSFPAPLLDVLGTEVNWLDHGEYQPDNDAVMNFRRALCRQKPYCLLMNTDYAKFTPGMVERYFQRCLFYGIWPGFFDQEAASKDPYWSSSKRWYDRDRPLFKQYIPLLRRVTAAGWQPLTYATCDNPKILLERFGPAADGTVFLTLINDSADTQSGAVTADVGAPGIKNPAIARELVSGNVAAPSGGGWTISLRPQQAEVLSLSRKSK